MSSDEIKGAGTRHVVENAVVIDGKSALEILRAVYPEQFMPIALETITWSCEDIKTIFVDATQLIYGLRDQVAFLQARTKTLSARPAK